MDTPIHNINEAVFEVIADTVGRIDPDTIEIVGGGSINRSYRLTTLQGATYLLKTNVGSALEMFKAEREGLEVLHRAGAIRVPEPILASLGGDLSFLLLEYIELGHKTTAAGQACGYALAELHRQRKPQFGWHRDNTIGSTPQINSWSDDWVRFFGHARLGYQLQLAVGSGIGESIQADGQRLRERLADFFIDYQPVASLLHGDLWGGNWGATYGEQPVIFDPAIYYGDRETDLAMTQLFGGFGPEFYAAYNESWQLDEGFQRRCDLYNLYHLLNHYNLFGGGYKSQVIELLGKLLA
ncbi:MAG: fructosamine kinase family protein [Gammaproteobacteria bacterium]|nr:fructosamine kinase family protein [Gammaproteobacteria bacterium]MDP7296419.1 fructosamine kinase family protein [Gammaproteobacteria bacterium]MDP7419161.1 fructosamine kinase family protein [Gammaproteobacteria bacterium]MDP7659676.1 fructosamine kinase family protein [Gammaproteobacteria bacterium]HJP38113.1 fructosamine kinase family protein [Gammaproteobacteria bacterium]